MKISMTSSHTDLLRPATSGSRGWPYPPPPVSPRCANETIHLQTTQYTRHHRRLANLSAAIKCLATSPHAYNFTHTKRAQTPQQSHASQRTRTACQSFLGALSLSACTSAHLLANTSRRGSTHYSVTTAARAGLPHVTQPNAVIGPHRAPGSRNTRPIPARRGHT